MTKEFSVDGFSTDNSFTDNFNLANIFNTLDIMKKQFALFVLLLISSIGISQEPSKSQNREKTWIYDINIIKDETGQTVKVEKTVFGKGTPGGPTQIRYFETKEKRDGSGNILFSTRERVGENNVDPEIVKQSETLPITETKKKK